jgi:hypothetical protein
MKFDRIEYCFNSKTHLLFEVKFRDKEETDKSKLYQWFLYDSDNDKLIPLDFVSMTDKKRVFKQGRLTFNDQRAVLFVEDDCGIDFKSMQFMNIENKMKLDSTFINVLARSVLVKHNK